MKAAGSDRSAALLAALAAALGGCVVPIGPDFEPETNLSPYLVTADPPVGSIVTKAPTEPEVTFRVVVGDPNLTDPLTYRWIFDYPGSDANPLADTPLGRSRDDRPEREPIEFKVSCDYRLADLKGQPHRLMLAVSDRGFVVGANTDLRLTTVPEGGRLYVAVWSVYIDCANDPGAR